MVFMGNPCGRGNCKGTECEKCSLFNPTIFDVKVPKWIGILGFRLEAVLNIYHLKRDKIGKEKF